MSDLERKIDITNKEGQRVDRDTLFDVCPKGLVFAEVRFKRGKIIGFAEPIAGKSPENNFRTRPEGARYVLLPELQRNCYNIQYGPKEWYDSAGNLVLRGK
jgi:hypothetical protein